MTASSPAVVITAQTPSTLGEGSAWWSSIHRLVTVDIAEGRIKYFDPTNDDERVEDIGGKLSAVIPRRSGGKVVAVGHELRAYDGNGEPDTSWQVEADIPLNRFNDCRSDRVGRIWAGTMSTERVPDQAALYRLDPDGTLTRELAPTTLSNGLGWSVHGNQMYFIDSTTYRVDVFDYDESAGHLSNRRIFAQIAPDDGLPDGLTVDRDGGVWVALFGGGAVRRYSRDGELTHHIPLPVTNPTCPAFGGESLDTLFVTSARIKLNSAQLRAEPAGALLAIPHLGFQGFSANECAV